MQQQTYLQTAQTGGVPILRQGYGYKKGGLRSHAYKKRWFVLTEDGRLLYFESNDSTAPLGQANLADDATLVHHKTEDFKLIIKTKARDWYLKYENSKTCLEWEESFQFAINLMFARHQPNAINRLHLDEDRQLKLLADEEAVRSLVSVTVTCFTWNMASRLPDIRELKFLKAVDSNIIAFGLQEYQAAASNLITKQHERNQRPPLDIWNAMLQSTLGSGYSMVATKCMGCMAITCFAHTDVVDFVSVLSTGSVPCGIGNVLYNKVGQAECTQKHLYHFVYT